MYVSKIVQTRLENKMYGDLIGNTLLEDKESIYEKLMPRK